MIVDFCDGEGAKALKEKIRSYWAERGYQVDLRSLDQGCAPRSARVDVRSDMLNGLPRGWTGRRGLRLPLDGGARR